MPNTMAAHLVERDGEKTCSVCKKVFQATAEQSLSRAFAAHVRSEHKPAPPAVWPAKITRTRARN